MKKTAKFTLTLFLCIAMLCTCASAFAACSKPEVVVVSGSSSVTPLMKKLAAEYEANNKNVRIDVRMSSSGEGIQDTQKDLNDFGMSSRLLKNTETGVEGKQLCIDGVALIVHKDNTTTNVAKDAVKELFLNGTQIPGTTIMAGIGRDKSSGTRGAFDELVKIDSTANYHTSISALAETGLVIEAISAQSGINSLGYISYGSLNNSVKAVSVDGVACTTENIKNNTYKLQRPFVIVLKTGKTLSAAAQGFYDYIMGDAAQTVIEKEKYVSVK